MKQWPEQFGRGLCWVAAGLAAVSLVSCRVCRTLNSDTYVGPVRAPVGKPAGGNPKAAGALPGGPIKPAAKAAADAAKAEPAAAKPPASPVPTKGPLAISIKEAVVMAMENNPELAVERLKPRILETYTEEERAVFDPLLTGTIGHERIKGERLHGRAIRNDFATESLVGEAALETLLPTGTNVALDASTRVDDETTEMQLLRSRVRLTVTQALLRGAGTRANLARVRQARLDMLGSEYELRGFAEALVALVELTYRDYVLAQHKIDIYTRAIALSEETRNGIQNRVKAGTLPTSAVTAAEAETALRRQNIIDARSDMAKAQVVLLQLISPRGANQRHRDIRSVNGLVMPHVQLDDVEVHVQVALRMRPDLNQARLQVERGDLQIVKTRNGLLPRLDLFVALGKTGYAETFGGSGKGVKGDGYGFLVGLSVEYPVGNRSARARHKRAVLGRRQAEEAVRNFEQLVQADVQTAYIEVNRTREKVAAIGTTRRLDEEKLRIESERFRLGQASSFQVARAQRDLVRRQIAEVEAIADHLKALVELYRLEGSLLERRGIEAPGAEPVDRKPAGP